MSATQSQQNALLKGLVVQALSLFVNTILAAKVGEKLFSNKVQIISSDEDGTVVDVSLGTRTKYRLTIKNIST